MNDLDTVQVFQRCHTASRAPRQLMAQAGRPVSRNGYIASKKDQTGLRGATVVYPFGIKGGYLEELH